MPNMSHHIVREQYLEVEVSGTESDGMALQRTLPALCRDWLLPEVERIFDRCAPQNGHFYIERLEVDAGRVALQSSEDMFVQVVVKAIEKSLREQLALAKPSAPFGAANVQHKTGPQCITEAFIHFLETGTLPWSFRLEEGSTLEEAILRLWDETLDSGFQTAALKGAVLRALASAHVRQRLVRQFSAAFLQTLLSQLSPHASAVMDAVVEKLRSSALNEKTTSFEEQLWESVFSRISAREAVTEVFLVSDAWHALSERGVVNQAATNAVKRHWPQLLRNYQAREYAGRKIAGSQETVGDRREHPESRQGIYIEDAGLVLLHPFLPQFFVALGVAAEEKLLQPERALCLLHFLATGQLSVPEYELMFPKILCGIPLEQPVESRMQLSEAEKDESQRLLEAVIRHWGALRNSSSDGLRGAFLLRPGKLSLRDDGDWLLQIESRTIDILLNQLPWGISMVKLPWMGRMLWVEW